MDLTRNPHDTVTWGYRVSNCGNPHTGVMPGRCRNQQINSEIRANVKNMESSEKREHFVQQAIQSKDYRTLRAVVSAPPFLSGTNPMTHTRWRTDLLDQLKPEMMSNRGQTSATWRCVWKNLLLGCFTRA